MSTALTMAADKSAYHLFNPTPVEQMRGLKQRIARTETESPYTVDAGHWQFEVDLLNWTHDDEDGVRTDSLAVLPINVKLGLTSSADIEFVFESWSQEKVRGTEAPEHAMALAI